MNLVKVRAPDAVATLRNDVLPRWSAVVEASPNEVPTELITFARDRNASHAPNPCSILDVEAEQHATGTDATLRGPSPRGQLRLFCDALSDWQVRWGLTGDWPTRHAVSTLHLWHHNPQVAALGLWPVRSSPFVHDTDEVAIANRFTFTIDLDETWVPDTESRKQAEDSLKERIRVELEGLGDAVRQHFDALESQLEASDAWKLLTRLKRSDVKLEMLVRYQVLRQDQVEISGDLINPDTDEEYAPSGVNKAIRDMAKRIGITLRRP